jgi:hypothetical protein
MKTTLIVVAVIIHYLLLASVIGSIWEFSNNIIALEDARLERASKYQNAMVEYLEKQGFKIPK